MIKENSRISRHQRNKQKNTRNIILSLVLINIIGIGGTFAYLTDTTEPLINTFFPAKVEVEVQEEFDKKEKRKIIVENPQNTGNIDAYVRIKLVSYRVKEDEGGNLIRIGGNAPVTIITTENWEEHNGFYYYILPVKTGERTYNLLAEPTILKDYSDDAGDPDGGKQVIEVLAEGIQSTPKEAVEDAWGINVDSDGHLRKRESD